MEVGPSKVEGLGVTSLEDAMRAFMSELAIQALIPANQICKVMWRYRITYLLAMVLRVYHLFGCFQIFQSKAGPKFSITLLSHGR